MMDVIKESFIAAATVLLLVISILAEANVVEVAKANPFMLFRNRIAPPPEAIPPAVTIRSPQNNVTYGSHYIALSFELSRPLLAKWESSLVEINYTLDGQSTQLYDVMKDGGNTPDQSGAIAGIPYYNITLASPFLISGNHRFSGMRKAWGSQQMVLGFSTLTVRQQFSLQLEVNPTQHCPRLFRYRNR